MNGYTLTWRGLPGPQPADGSLFRPDTLASLGSEELARRTLAIGRTGVPLGTCCQIEGAAGDRLTLRGFPRLDRLGAHMTGGELVIEGNAGDDLGASMSGGCIRVRGSVGARCGGPDHDRDRGMTGGEIYVDGDAGDFAALRMRRGLLAVRGRAGRSPGYRMLAGTVVLHAPALDWPGLEMRRGTLLLLGRGGDAPGEPFREDGIFPCEAMPALGLLLRHLDKRGWKVDPEALTGRYRLLSGDHMALAKGEIWQWVN